MKVESPQSTNQEKQHHHIGGLETLHVKEDAQAESEAQTAAAGSGGKKRKAATDLRSPYWKFYELVWVEEGDPPVEKRKGKCLRCGSLIAADSSIGTSGLKNHQTRSCSKLFKAKRSQTILNYTPSTDGSGAGSLTYQIWGPKPGLTNPSPSDKSQK